MISPYARMAYVVLRLAAAFAFAYPAINAVGDPNSWIGYFPPFILSAAAMLGISGELVLHTWGAVEILIALWILSGWKIFWPCIAATVALVAVVLFNLPQMQILFRDLSIAGLTLALALMHWPKKEGLASAPAQV